MFCSHCGKSIPADEAACPHCGAVLGEDRFEGNMYTSAQARVPLDQIERTASGEMSAFTRTDYMSYDNQPEGDLYSNTTYRPLLSDDEDMSREDETYAEPEEDAFDPEAYEEGDAAESGSGEDASEPAFDEGAEYPSEYGSDDMPGEPSEDNQTSCDEGYAEDYAQSADAAYDDEPIVDAPEYDEPTADSEPPKYELRELKPARISPKVQRYMREMEERKAGKAGKAPLRDRLGFGKRSAALYEEEDAEPAADIPGYEDAPDAVYADDAAPEGVNDTANEDFNEAADEAAYEATNEATNESADEAVYGGEAYDEAYDSDQDAAYDEAAYGDVSAYDDSYDEEQETARPAFNASAVLDTLKSNKKLQIGLGAVLALIVIVFGVRYLLYVTSSLGTKIAGVTNSVYSQGIALIDTYTSDTYRSDMVKSCAVNPTYAQEEMDKDMAALSALLPDAPQENDELFVTTLTILHEAVQTIIKADADAEYNGTTEARAEASTQEWLVVQDAVAQLKNAATVAQLTTLATQVEGAIMPTPTPSPTPPAVTATPSTLYSTLQESNTKSDAAKKLQARLIELGYLDDTADGYYGAKTTEAVKQFQTAMGMTADGIATSAVQEALYASDAPAAGAAAPAADTEPTEGDTPAENGDA